ncbi:R3H and coiled-coil domain-containing protein 1 isoform X2 [Oryzias latipes]|uniref:R3H domain and coiled-coil containing 1 n=1 Tax=Oryzias latipes TaxID=8090 RepID=H2MQL8_ORYLA|nr:R3H and coiled-coil domain-containing protein 1 isoform X2 [Oryzias latipes]
MEELETYQAKSNPKSVLLFPPLPSRLRFLIHKIAEGLPHLATFSVGENWWRRVVVCFSELRKTEVDEDADSGPEVSLCDEPARFHRQKEGETKAKPSASSQSRAPKRPDQPLYMPRAARQRLSLQNSTGPAENHESQSSACGGVSLGGLPQAGDRHKAAAESDADASGNNSASCPEEKRKPSQLSLREDLVLEQTQSCLSELSLEQGEDAESSDLTREADHLTKLIKSHLKEAECVSVHPAHNDYSAYESLFCSDHFHHVIEIYDFPVAFQTQDLLNAFTDYSSAGMKIKWVDDTHALGVFSSEDAAQRAASIDHPALKARSLSEGSKRAKRTAVKHLEFLQPVKERPKTDSAVARRMVTRALGLPGRDRGRRF